MYYFADGKQTSTAKLSIFLVNFKKRAHGLRVNETKYDTENASDWDDFGFRGKNEPNCDDGVLFRVCLQKFDLYFNP